MHCGDTISIIDLAMTVSIVRARSICSHLSAFVVYVQYIPGDVYTLLRMDHGGGKIAADAFCANYN